MHEEFKKTFERANLQTWVDDTNTLRAIEDCKSILKNIDPRLKKEVTGTQAKENPWSDQGFYFEIGSNGKKFMKLRFTDPSGEYYHPDASSEHKDYIKQQLNECATKTDGILVIVTENLERPNILYKAGVWRGFASRLEEPARKTSPEKKTETILSWEPTPLPGTPSTTPPQNQKIRLMIILLIAAIIIWIVISLKPQIQPQPQKAPQPQQAPQSQTHTQQILELQPQPTLTPQPQSQQQQILEP